MGSYPPRVALAPRTPGWVFHAVRGGIDPGDCRFRPRFVRVVDMEGFLMRGWDHILPGWHWLDDLRTPGWGFHTVRGGIDPGDHRFRPRSVTSIDVWKDLWSGDGILSSPSGAGSTNPLLGFPHRGGRYRPGRPPFSSPGGWSCRCMEGFLIRE